MKNFSLEIRTPDSSLVSTSATKLRLRAADGELEILPDHAALATILAPGQIFYTLESGEEKSLDSRQGFLLIEKNKAVVLLKN